uniref:Sushi domain-containing protein n=1 Tax=Dromaius novaehollandiae TaxID=8790 RepID=A0A8C4K725_DRONO
KCPGKISASFWHFKTVWPLQQFWALQRLNSNLICGCAAPPGLRFAELTEEYKNQREFSVGDTVQYTCQPGYMRHPGIPPTVTCLKNQTWSEVKLYIALFNKMCILNS